MLMRTLENTKALETEIDTLSSLLLSIQEEAECLVSQSGKVAKNFYQQQYEMLVERYHNLQKAYDDKYQVLQEKKIKQKALQSFIDILRKQENLSPDYDEKLFNTLVDKLMVYKGKKIEVHFKNGQVISL